MTQASIPATAAAWPAPDGEQIRQFLKLLGKPGESCRLRAFFPKGHPKKPTDRGRKEIGHDGALRRIEAWQREERGVYLVIGNGGDSEAEITSSPAFFIEHDDRPKNWQVGCWQELGLPEPTVQVDTGGRSVHSYWVLHEPMDPQAWKEIQRRLLVHAAADTSVGDIARVMRLPGCWHMNAEGRPDGMARIITSAGHRYSPDQIEACLPSPEPPPRQREPITLPAGHLPRHGDARPLQEVMDGLERIPPILPDNGQREQFRSLAWGLLCAVREAGSDDATALQLLEAHSPQVPDTATYFETEPHSITAATFWKMARDHGWRPEGERRQEPLRDAAAAPAGDPPAPAAEAPAAAAEAPLKPYGELLRAMLLATIAGNDDDLMALRAEAIARFRRTDAQLEAALFKLHAQLELGIQPGTEPESLDLSRISGMDWLIEGFIPDNDQTLIWGNAGSGKTTAALAAAQAVLLGTGLLDHDHPATPGSVLFIASDSGAPPLYAALQDMGMADLAEVQEGPGKRFHVWAADHGQGMAAWAADLRGCVRLLQFIQRHGIRLVLIDSCKAVCSGAGLDYQNNQLVTALLTYFKEVICPHAAVVWLNHDGTARGAHAGAKAWKEVPSMVHRIIREENRDGSFANDRRQWSVIKSRMGPTREFFYELEQGTLSICAEVERVGNCLEQVVAVLADAWQQEGRASLDMAELTRRVCGSPRGPSAKTLRNTLTTATRARHPEVCREGRGRYRLAPRIIDSLKGVHSRRDILPENPVPDSDLSMSRLCPAGQTGQTEGPTHQGSEVCPDECPGTNVGTMANASHANGSGPTKSRGTCTPLGNRIACTLDGEPGWTRCAGPMGRSVVVIHADGRQLAADPKKVADA